MDKRSVKPPIIAKIASAWLEKLEQQEQSRSNPYGLPDLFSEFCRKHCQIRSGTSFVPFVLYEYQELIADLASKYSLSVLKVRQMGCSEVFAAWMLYNSLRSPGYSGVTFSIGQTESSQINLRTQQMPVELDLKWTTQNAGLLKSEYGGTLIYKPSTPDASRGLPSVAHLFFDEWLFIQKLELLYASATPTQKMVSKDVARIYLNSTLPPEGLDSFHGELFLNGNGDRDLEEEINRVREGRGRQLPGLTYWIDDDNWAKILLHWTSHPIYSSIPNYLGTVRRREKVTDDQLNREHDLQLPKSGGSLFNTDAIESFATGSWKLPQQGAKYLMGVDSNMGGEDNWVTQVWRIDTHPFQLVEEYAENNMLPSYCTAKTLELIDLYRPVICAIEKNNGGLTVSENVVKARSWLRVELVNTTSMSKILNTDRIAIALTSGDVVFPVDWLGIGELKRFARKERRAMGNGKDDRVMAWAITFALLEEALTNTMEAQGRAAANRIRALIT